MFTSRYVIGAWAQAFLIAVIALAAAMVPTRAEAQHAEFRIIKDVAPGLDERAGVEATAFYAGDGTLYLGSLGSEAIYGYELHRLNTTTNKLERLNDIAEGTASSYPRHFNMVDGKLYFRASRPNAGSQLWVYDPADGSTTLAVDVTAITGPNASSSKVVVLDGKLYFPSYNAFTNNRNVLRFDPAQPEAGVTEILTDNLQLVRDIFVWRNSLWIIYSREVDGSVLHKLEDGDSSFTPVTMNGNLTISELFISSDRVALTDDYLIFSNYNQTYGSEPVVFHAATGEFVLYDIYNGSFSGSPGGFISSQSNFYFIGRLDDSGYDTLMLDPTTGQVTSVVPHTSIGFQSDHAAVGSKILFRGQPTDSFDQELYEIDTTDNSYRLVADIWPGEQGSSPRQFTQLGNLVYFLATPRSGGSQLFTYDLLSGDVAEQTGVVEAPKNSFPHHLSSNGDRISFAAHPTGSGYIGELSREGETQQQPQLPQLVNHGTSQATNQDVIQLDDVNDNAQMFLYDFADGSFKQISDLTPELGINLQIIDSEMVGDYVFYHHRRSNDDTNVIVAYHIPTEVSQVVWSAANTSVQSFYKAGDRIFGSLYSAQSGWVGFQLNSDGSFNLLPETEDGHTLNTITRAIAFNGDYYLSAYAQNFGIYWIYRYDPVNNTIDKPFADENAFDALNGVTQLNHTLLASDENYLYFYAYHQGQNKQLIYKLDSAGLLAELPNTEDAWANRGVVLDDYLIFSNNNLKISVYDLTQNALTVINSFDDKHFEIANYEVVVASGRVFFSSRTIEYGYGELFEVIPATGEVKLVAEINQGPPDSYTVILGSTGERLIVTGYDQTYGLEPFEVVFNAAPTISGTPTLSVAEGQPYSFIPTASDADEDPFSFSIQNKPSWAEFSTETGALTGTPGFTDAGVYDNIIISAADATGSSSLPAFDITVTNTNRPPVLSGTPPTEVDEGQLYTFTPTVSDPDVDDELTFDVFNLPDWASFNYHTGTLSGTPNFDQAANYSDIRITVNDGTAEDQIGPFMISVRNVNRAPTISGTPQLEVDEGQLYAFQVTAFDPDNNHLVFEISGNPDWMNIDADTGAVTGMPDFTSAGVYSNIEVSVTDGPARAALPPFTVTVNNVNRAPTIGGTPDFQVNEGQAYSFVPTVTDADAEDILTFSILNKPSWASFNTATGALTGTPSFTDADVYPNISISVSDGTDTTPMPPFSITVNNVNRAPEITNSPLLTLKDGEAYSYVPEVSDPDTAVDDTESFSFSIENMPTWAMFDTETGALTGTPSVEDVAEWADIVITVTDRDGLSDSVGPFTIVVTVSNTPPRAVNDAFTITSGESFYRLDVLANDEDDDVGDTLRIVGVTQPVSGVAASIVDGAIELRGIASSFSGTLTFNYTIRDSANEQSSAQVVVTVQSANTVVITTPADIEVNATALFTRVPLGTATAVDGNGRALRVRLVNGALFFEPGHHTVIWQATDSNGQSAEKAQQVRVHPLVSLSKNQTVSADTPFSVDVSLNGVSPRYPFDVTVLVDDQPRTVTFANGSVLESLQFDGISAAAGSMRLALPASVNRGSQNVSTVTVAEDPKFTEAQLAQTKIDAGSLLAASFKVNTREALTVRVKFVSSVNSSQSFEYDDIPTDSGLLSLAIPFDVTPGLYVSTFELLRGDEVVDLKRVQRLEVTPGAQIGGGLGTDGQGIEAFEYAPGDDDLSRELDQNGNGLVDYEDGRWDDNGNAIVAYLDRAITQQQIWTGSAFAQVAGDALLRFVPPVYQPGVDAGDIRVTQTPAGMSVQAAVDIDDYQFIGDFYSFEVAQLANAGAQTQVVLPLDQPLAGGAAVLLWRAGGWHSFEVSANEQVFSAGAVAGFCPDPGAVAWQPGLNEGHWCVQLQLIDGGLNDSDGVADGLVQVFAGAAYANSGNRAPVAVTDSVTVVWRGSASIPALVNDTDADGDELSIISASVTGGTVTVNAAGTHLNYVTDGDLGGDFVITYVITDHNGGVAVGTVNVTVLANRAPVAGADTTVTVAGRPVTVNVLANDADPDGDSISVISASVGASAGSVSHTASSVTFAPAAGFTGVAAVSYTVSDGRGGETVGTLNVQVNAAVEVIDVRPATGAFSWWLLALGGLLLAGRRRLR